MGGGHGVGGHRREERRGRCRTKGERGTKPSPAASSSMVRQVKGGREAPGTPPGSGLSLPTLLCPLLIRDWWGTPEPASTASCEEELL